MDTDGGQLLPLAMSIAYVCNCGGALRCCHAKLAPPSVAGQWFPARSSLLLTAEVGCGQCELNMNFNEPAELPASFFDAAVVCFRSLDEVARGEVARGEVAQRWCLGCLRCLFRSHRSLRDAHIVFCLLVSVCGHCPARWTGPAVREANPPS